MAKKNTPYRDLLPPLSTSEKDALKASIKAEGVRDPVILDEDGNVLDGHHRLDIKKDAPTRVIKGLSEAEKMAFVFASNFTRRNLSATQKKEKLAAMKKVAVALRKEDAKKNTQKRVATMLGVSRQTVAYWWAEEKKKNTPKGTGSDANVGKPSGPNASVKIPPTEKPVIAERIEAGETQVQVAADYGVTTRTISGIVKKATELHSRDDDKARKTAHLKGSMFEVRRGDFRKVLKDITDISLILTDPPYPKEHLPLWSDLGKWAAKSLADDGILIAYSGQMYLPDVLTRLSKHLEYWWTGALIHKGSGNITPLGHPVRKVKNKWKPLVMFFKRGGHGFDKTFDDLLVGEGCEKTHHNWQQPVAEAAALIERFTKKNELVVDPFAGSGGFCKAAHDLGRIAIGAEILKNG